MAHKNDDDIILRKWSKERQRQNVALMQEQFAAVPSNDQISVCDQQVLLVGYDPRLNNSTTILGLVYFASLLWIFIWTVLHLVWAFTLPSGVNVFGVFVATIVGDAAFFFVAQLVALTHYVYSTRVTRTQRGKKYAGDLESHITSNNRNVIVHGVVVTMLGAVIRNAAIGVWLWRVNELACCEAFVPSDDAELRFLFVTMNFIGTLVAMIMTIAVIQNVLSVRTPEFILKVPTPIRHDVVDHIVDIVHGRRRPDDDQ